MGLNRTPPTFNDDDRDKREAQQLRKQVRKTLIEVGFTPDSVAEAIANNDLAKLEHSGAVSAWV